MLKMSRSALVARERELTGTRSSTSTEGSAIPSAASASSDSVRLSHRDSAARTTILRSIQRSRAEAGVHNDQTAHGTLSDLRTSTLPLIRRAGTLSAEARQSQLVDRLEDYKATVWTVTEDAPLPQIVREIIEVNNVTTLVTPGDLDRTWTTEVHAEILSDHEELPRDQLERASATLSACALAISETGTIVLDGGVGQGRRILSLLPDHLIVVVRGEQICELVPEAVARLTPTRPQTWISGPSATSDIELVRVEGVHGPRRLDVIIVPNSK
ncbi:MAG: LutC/YkgG family protein [Acidimicrobiales bacterium]